MVKVKYIIAGCFIASLLWGFAAVMEYSGNPQLAFWVIVFGAIAILFTTLSALNNQYRIYKQNKTRL